MTGLTTLHIAAAILRRADGHVLLVRKQGTSAFMQPGGKIEPSEAPIMALCRELHEELGLKIAGNEPTYLGRFSAPAANEAGWTVTADIFQITCNAPVEAAAEIAEIAWIDPFSPAPIVLAPLTRDHILPLCRKIDR